MLLLPKTDHNIKEILMDYFERVVLQSVELPVKPSYNLSEMCAIFCCDRRTLRRKAENGDITVTENGRVYFVELQIYFSKKRWQH
jgi:hypothetical protein